MQTDVDRVFFPLSF